MHNPLRTRCKSFCLHSYTGRQGRQYKHLLPFSRQNHQHIRHKRSCLCHLDIGLQHTSYIPLSSLMHRIDLWGTRCMKYCRLSVHTCPFRIACTSSGRACWCSILEHSLHNRPCHPPFAFPWHTQHRIQLHARLHSSKDSKGT